ncbi:Rpn family recombination-promoting nuclease/putative transposase [Desulfoscipio gibsoniae]|uniref:Uncharacterized protein n=1 Tax=Desulfoscipio gibsoniae DSM 7213 TaxID=767817 RepID=R4KKD6_9FIRM|nr:Rpn family recombination-promoting nuclease/putative transposase [Desulfoscipio gibsoniae]AGL03678.1 hypothetical protein Desgi_4440 [Desulfoscipio gibsoniae DSM 7213]
MAEYDLILKALAEQYPEHFVTIVRGPGAEVEKIERLEKEAVATQRTLDILLKVTESGYEYVLLIEIQTRPDKTMPLRLLEYTAMHHRTHKKPVYPVLINLTGQGYREECYTYECLDITVINFNYRQFNLSEMNGREFIHAAPVGLLPLVPLMRHSDPPQEVLEACSKRFEREVSSDQDRANLFLGLAVISSLKLSKEIILKVIEVSKMENSPLFDGIREEWEDKGKVKGIIFAILKTLEKKIGKKPDKFFESRLGAIDNEDTIEKLFYVAIEAESIEQFTKALEKVEQERTGY